MSTKKRGLGRGLDALLGVPAAAPTPAAAAPEPGAAGGDALRQLPVDVIVQGRYQPRLSIKAESLEDLAASIRAQGVVQPVVVRPLPTQGRYELIAGERRWRAAQLAGLERIPALVRDVPDQAAMSMALIENVQRENLNPLDEALALERLLREFGMTHQAIAEAIGRSRAAVSNLLRLLELAGEAKALLESGEIEMGHARALLALPAHEQGRVAREVARKGLSVRETEALVRKATQPAAAPRRESARPDPDVQRLENDLTERLGARVRIQQGRGGQGSLVIRYGSLEELDGILGHLK